MKLIYSYFFFVIVCFSSFAKTISVLETGAKGDGKTIDTKAIQKAIDLVFAEGGGKVILPAGKTYLSGSLLIKSNITFEIEGGAILKGSPNREDYIPFERELFHWRRLEQHPLGWNRHHLINIRNAENVMICGMGIIDGNGDTFWKPYKKEDLPKWIDANLDRVSNMIELYRSSRVTLRDVKLVRSPEWTVHIYSCQNVLVSGITIDNGLYGPNNDGIDITGSKGVRISDCNITSCDDAVCLKTGPKSGPCEEITVTNCVIKTLCVALKIGNESYDDIRNVTFNNCVVTGSSRIIGVYGEEGGVIENIRFSNIIGNTNAPLVLNRPIHIALYTTKDEFLDATRPNRPSKIRNITIENFECVTDGRVMIGAETGSVIENLTLKNIKLNYALIDDPSPIAVDASSAQFRHMRPEDKVAKAAFVLTNIHHLTMKDIEIQWPIADLPSSWFKFDRRIENGSLREHKRDYTKIRETEFQIFKAYNVTQSLIDIRRVESSSLKLEQYSLENSDIDIIK